MAKYCRFCGNPIEEGTECTCQKQEQERTEIQKPNVRAKLEETIGIPNEKGKKEALEREQRIVPDCIVANEGEIPIRQYEIAKLRTLIKGAFAEGRLQVTNQRVLFRAAGYSLLGKNQLQYEFAIDEIAGIEMRKDHRLGVFHFILAWILCAMLMSWGTNACENIAGMSSFLAGLFCVGVFGVAMVFYVAVRGKLFFKLMVDAVAAGALSVYSFSTKYLVIPVIEGNFFSVLEGICLIALIVNVILIAYVPNLVLDIKTKSASAPIEIRRKESNGILAFLFNMPKKEYTGFSDVMPGKDTEKAMKELGALMRDINILGDDAVKKWKEN